jgi:hypothetical protein
MEDRLNFLAELSGMSRTAELDINAALNSGNWWLRPALDGAFYFRCLRGAKTVIIAGFARGDHYYGYAGQQEPRPEEGQIACFLTRPPPVRDAIDFSECVPPEDRCPGVLLEILGALKTPTFASLRTEAPELDLSNEAYDLLARRGIKTKRDFWVEAAIKMAPVLAAIRAGPG